MKPIQVALGLVFLLVTYSQVCGAVIDPFTFSPTANDPNLRAWFRADSGVVTSGSNVTGWVDGSVSISNVNRNLTGVNNPQFIAAEPTLNNMPVVRFNSANATYLNRLAGNAPVTGNTDRTTFMVITNGTSPGASHMVHWGNQTGDQAYGVLFRATANIGNHYWIGFDPGTTSPTSAATAIAFAYDGNGTSPTQGLDSFFVNGNAAGAIIPSTTGQQLITGANEFVVGSRIGPHAEAFTGDIAEIIIYDELLTATQMGQIYGYLEDKYGLTIAGALAAPGLPVTIAPEPATLVLWGFAGIGLMGFSLRRRAAARRAAA